IQEPIGVSGVQAVPKTLHSHGFFTPFKISPHWQAFGSATLKPATGNFSSASKAAYFSFNFMPLCAIEPKPRHKKKSARFENFGQHLERLAIAVTLDGAPVLIFDLGPAFDDLFDDHINGLQNIERFETGHDQRFFIFRRHKFITEGADHGADMAGADKTIEL